MKIIDQILNKLKFIVEDFDFIRIKRSLLTGGDALKEIARVIQENIRDSQMVKELRFVEDLVECFVIYGETENGNIVFSS